MDTIDQCTEFELGIGGIVSRRKHFGSRLPLLADLYFNERRCGLDAIRLVKYHLGRDCLVR